jgi:tetratricopeptide (TPR) repeat protein
MLAGCGGGVERAAAPPAPSPATWVGAAACAACHAAETRAWQGSHHDLAMQEATDRTVLGDFGGATFEYAGTTTRFFRRDGRPVVTTDGPDGRLADFPVRYVFGVAPLQQYLVEFPDGRLQALSISWDSRPAEAGGQRWFHLYPAEAVTHADPLHWTRPSQNWNFMCAECHSTNLRRNYDEAADRFATTWTDLDVACEACHGPGSNHVAWARSGRLAVGRLGLVARFEPRGEWLPDAATGNARRREPLAAATEVEACGLCHARRAQLAEGHQPGRPLADTHLPALLTAGLYAADGQMQDEVYNYGSFLQSRMHAAGVTCSDCHEPHSLKLRAEGSGVCARCHAPAKYAAPAHHRHAPGSAAAECVSCHMPARTYMVVDERHDHSFRIPRPDLSDGLGTPNACNDCHADRSPAWAATAIAGWHGPDRKGFQTFGPALAAARGMQPDAPALLVQVARDPAQPAIARATALAALAPWIDEARFATLNAGLTDLDPLVRLGALQGLEGLPAANRWAATAPLLGDPVRAVRLAVVSFLLAVPPAELRPEQRQALDPGIAEYLAVQDVSADRAESRTNRALVWQYRGDAARAEAELRAALRLEPSFIPARVNLADLLRATGRDAEGERELRAGIEAYPREGALHHALGLRLVRAGQIGAALPAFRQATELAPESAHYAYVYAIALNSAGRGAEAVRVLRASQRRHPADPETLSALAGLLRQRGQAAAAREFAAALDRLFPAPAATGGPAAAGGAAD